MEYYLQSDEPVESLWVKIWGLINKGDTVVGVCYRSPKQKEADDTFRQLQGASYLQVLILMRLQLPHSVVEEASQQDTGSPGGFWNELMTSC